MLVLALTATAGEPPPGAVPAPAAAPPPAAVPFEVKAPAGMSLSATPTGQVGSLRGGAQVLYESCRIHADTITAWLSPIEQRGGLALERAVLEPGPAGPAGGRVLIDTRATQLPMVGLRGLLLPRAVRSQRWPADPQHQGKVFFDLDCDQLGDFVASVRVGADWVPLAGWAHVAHAVLVADLVDGSPSNYRFHEIHLHGEVVDGKLRRPAAVMRTRQLLPEPRPFVANDPQAEAWVSSEVYSLHFGDQGEFQEAALGNHTTGKGIGDVIPQRQPKAKSRPVPTSAR